MRGKYGIFAFLMVLVATSGWALGVLFPGPGWNLWSVGQEAIYVVRPGVRARFRVALIPRVVLRGNASEFGMLVPTPSEPTLSTVGGAVFDEASFITQPLPRQRSLLSDGCGGNDVVSSVPPAIEGGGAQKGGVDVLQEKSIGAFEVAVLSAGSSSELVAWLDRHGYRHNVEEARVLDEYIARRWVFTALRLRRNSSPPEPIEWQTEPLMLLYETETLTYPMRLAALSASPSDGTRLLLYLIAEKRMIFDRARTRYANRISRKELERIRADAPIFGGLLSEGVFLTKLSREYSLFEEKEDFTFRETASREYQETAATYRFEGAGVGVLCLLGWCGRYALRRKGRRT